MIAFICMAVPIVGCPIAGCGSNGAHVTMILIVIQVILLLRITSSSGKASSLKTSSWRTSSLEASSSSIEGVVEVIETRSSKVAVEVVATASAPVLRVIRAVFPKVHSIVSPTRLVALSVLPLLLEVFELLCFGLGFLFVVVFLVSHFFLLFHEVFNLFL